MLRHDSHEKIRARGRGPSVSAWVRRLHKSGNSIVLALPDRLRAVLGLHPGDLVALGAEDGRLVARRFEPADVLRSEHDAMAKVRAKRTKA